MNPQCTSRRTDRQGFTLVETAVAAILMSALLLLLGQAAGWASLARRQADRRQVALFEANNVLERIAATPFELIDNDTAAKVGLSDAARNLLGTDALQVGIQKDDSTPAFKRLSVEVQYGDSPNLRQSVRLTAWVYRRGDQ